jgi:Ser/Thr protein kinase RdoA (MazF antagonist)
MADAQESRLTAGLRELEGSHGRATWADAEQLVTEGYARVLALEAERLGVMRDLVRLAASADTAHRAASLTSELDAISAELSALRRSLRAVRRAFRPVDEVPPAGAIG